MRGMFGSTLRFYPGKFVGIRFPYNPAFIQALKDSVPLKMWDALSKTWWFPEDALSTVEALALQHGAATQEDLRRFRVSVPVAVQREPYEVLGLVPGAPFGLVKVAHAFWSREFSNAGGTSAKLAEVDEALLAIRSQERDT